MIKPNELRIGNLIYGIYENEIDRGNGIVEDVECIEQVEYSGYDPLDNYTWVNGGTRDEYDSFKGIPLTKEWLLKVGFERRTGYGFKKSNFELIVIKAIDSNGYHFKYNLINIKIDYIHQLQNLFFVLTGEELTIKE